MSERIEIPSDWVCTGAELKPKAGANSGNTWVLSGSEIKHKTNATSANTWVWDGRELKPKKNAASSNTWVIELNHEIPMQALKRWQISHPDLFLKEVRNRPGHDNYVSLAQFPYMVISRRSLCGLPTASAAAMP